MKTNEGAFALTQEDKECLAKLSGQKRLAFLLKLNLFQIAKFHSLRAAEEILDENLDLIEESDTEEAAYLLAIKAYFASMKVDMDEARIILEKALVKSRAVKSVHAEAMAIAIKGYHKNSEKQHEKAAVWYQMALKNIPDIYRADVLCALGASYGVRGKYELAWQYFNDAITETKKLIKKYKDQKSYLLEIQVDTLSMLATLLEIIDDFDGAEKSHDKAIKMARDNGFTWALYKALSRKVRFFNIKKDFKAAKDCLVEAEKLSADVYDPRVPFYIAHDWARQFYFTAKNKADLQKALNKYEEILYGSSTSKEEMDAHILLLMKNLPILFDEIINGIYECLIATREEDKEKFAEELKATMASYNKVLTEGGLYVEIDKPTILEIERRIFTNLLERIFRKPRAIAYNGINVRYDYDKEEAWVTIKESSKEFWLNKKAFLILEYLHIHRGHYVSEDELARYWELNMVAGTGIRHYISQYIRGELGLTPFLEQKRPEGWKLIDLDQVAEVEKTEIPAA